MTQDHLQSLRRLAKRYHIRSRPPSEEWPEAHAKTFQNIKTLGQYRFDTYSHSVSVLSDEEPWKQQTQTRAQWLVSRAERLFGQDRNEAGWRFGLENDVLRRFTVEVACPKCRARVWQSEIQAAWTNEDEGYAQQLEERRKRRRPCQCPPDERPKDFYELGTNSLFDDRAQEFVIYDDLVKSQLPKQGPDRVFGLQNTANFDTLLSSPVRSDLAKTPGDTIADSIKTTPFKTQADPLLFPFLVLEAKSEASASGFDAILVQSSFPIRALLKMQDDLRSNVSEVEGSFDPLVWFLASRGDAWRVYSGYITKGKNGEPITYDITLLWTGSLLHKDNALQLVLIVDYIMDWARDVYRIAIMRQLKSLVTGKPFDQISFADSDIFSMRRDISKWIPAPPSTIFHGFTETTRVVNSQDDHPSTSLEEHVTLDIQIPDFKYGCVKPASSAKFRFVCLYLTEKLVPSFFQVIKSLSDNESYKRQAAYHVIDFVTKFDEVLVMSKADLELFEMLWTDAAVPPGSAEDSDDFYVIMEASWYFNSSWEIIREVSCLAVTKSALKLLMTYEYANFGAEAIECLPKRELRCTSSAIRELIDCIRSGSPWQVLLATISCTFVTIYPLSFRGAEVVHVLGLGYTDHDLVKSFIMNYLRLNIWEPTPDTSVPVPEVNTLVMEKYRMNMDRERSIHTDTSWKRISEKRRVLKHDSHDHSRCGRCIKGPMSSNISPFAHGYLDTRNQPVLSYYNAILVVSLQCTGHEVYFPDSCVFTLGNINEMKDNNRLLVTIKSLLEDDLIYHTLKHDANYPPPPSECMYNLPLPYRSVASEERFRLQKWIHEIQDENFLKHKKDEAWEDPSKLHEWNSTLTLMHLLRAGYTDQEASHLMSS